MENITNELVKSVIKNDRLEVTYKEKLTESNYTNEVSKKCSQIVHADLREKLAALRVHVALICEQPEAAKINDVGLFDYDPESEELDKYVVTGISIGGSDENSGVTIIAQKLLKSGQVLNLIVPFTKYEDLENYKFAGELCADVQAVEYEVEQYLFHQKWGIKQAEFDFEAPEESDVEISIGDGKEFKKVDLKKMRKLAESA